VASRAAGELLSLPLYPALTDAQIDHVIDAVNAFDDRAGRAGV
jgi:dTDP-4-amino-4,6-dideoxygalactose transaminase